MGASQADETKIQAALQAVTTGSRQVMAGRRQPELKAARAHRNRAILKAVQLTDMQRVAAAAGLSTARAKQICEQHSTRRGTSH